MNCYSTFVENIFNYYEGGPYSPTVHITPNSPIAKSILISQNRGFIVKRRHIKFCLNINIYSILNPNQHKEISNTQLSPKIDSQKSKSRQYKFRLIWKHEVFHIQRLRGDVFSQINSSSVQEESSFGWNPHFFFFFFFRPMFTAEHSMSISIHTPSVLSHATPKNKFEAHWIWKRQWLPGNSNSQWSKLYMV